MKMVRKVKVKGEKKSNTKSKKVSLVKKKNPKYRVKTVDFLFYKESWLPKISTHSSDSSYPYTGDTLNEIFSKIQKDLVKLSTKNVIYFGAEFIVDKKFYYVSKDFVVVQKI